MVTAVCSIWSIIMGVIITDNSHFMGWYYWKQVTDHRTNPTPWKENDTWCCVGLMMLTCLTWRNSSTNSSSLKHFRNTTTMFEAEAWKTLLHHRFSFSSHKILSYSFYFLSFLTCALSSWHCSIPSVCFPLLEKIQWITYTSWDFTQRALGWGNGTITVQYLFIST